MRRSRLRRDLFVIPIHQPSDQERKYRSYGKRSGYAGRKDDLQGAIQYVACPSDTAIFVPRNKRHGAIIDPFTDSVGYRQ